MSEHLHPADTWLDDGDVRLYHGDALECLRDMPAESVQCIVTSPPFWGLRDYGVDGQIGLEETPDEWCAKLVAVMREARRVLRSDGVCWIEVGDTYASGGRGGNATEERANGFHGSFKVTTSSLRDRGEATPARHDAAGIKPKDLVGAPWLLAFALRADGWYLRSDTIWARPNPMPESVTDRPTKAHSYVFLLTKSARYYYDADAIREPASNPLGALVRTGEKAKIDPNEIPGHRNGKGRSSLGSNTGPSDRNARSVWSIATEPTPFAHFATFPQALVERCILAGTSEHGACSECGAPWRRITEREFVPQADVANTPALERHNLDASNGREGTPRGTTSSTTKGWEPSCKCAFWGYDPVPCVVLDPFMGSGTTALVARRLNRHAVGIELNADYLAIAERRLQQMSLLAPPATT